MKSDQERHPKSNLGPPCACTPKHTYSPTLANIKQLYHAPTKTFYTYMAIFIFLKCLIIKINVSFFLYFIFGNIIRVQ